MTSAGSWIEHVNVLQIDKQWDKKRFLVSLCSFLPDTVEPFTQKFIIKDSVSLDFLNRQKTCFVFHYFFAFVSAKAKSIQNRFQSSEVPHKKVPKWFYCFLPAFNRSITSVISLLSKQCEQGNQIRECESLIYGSDGISKYSFHSGKKRTKNKRKKDSFASSVAALAHSSDGCSF